MKMSDAIYGVFFQPAATLRQISEDKPLAKGLILYILVSLLGVLFNQGVESSRDNSILAGGAGWALGALSVFFALVNLFVMTGVMSLLADIIYKKSNPSGILACFSFAALPGVMGGAVYYTFFLLGMEGVGAACLFAISIWVMVLGVLSLRESLDLDTGQSVLLFLVPPLAVFFLTAVLLFAGLSLAW
ncbi:MAG: YIP1 family protein [Syntrophomonadaceae bacterium]